MINQWKQSILKMGKVQNLTPTQCQFPSKSENENYPQKLVFLCSILNTKSMILSTKQFLLSYTKQVHKLGVSNIDTCQNFPSSLTCPKMSKSNFLHECANNPLNLIFKFFRTRNTLLVTWLYSTYVVSDKWWLKLVNLTFDICVFSFSFCKTSKLRPSNAGPRGMAAFSPAWRKLGVHKIVFTGYNFFQGGQIFLTYPYFNYHVIRWLSMYLKRKQSCSNR